MNRNRILLAFLVASFLLLTACGSNETANSAPTDAATAQIEAGRKIFQANCAACHATEGEQVIVGPSMVGLASRAGETIQGMDAETYIEQSITDPAAHINEGFQNLMPNTYSSALSQDELDALVAYLMTFE
ncbi:cytochrome c [bacterium]|nr:cytochrome c [bacterium]